jgi:hypothetical protein
VALLFSSASRAATGGIAGGALRDAIAGLRAAAASEAAVDPWIEGTGRSRGGEKGLYASSGARRVGSDSTRCT